MAMMSWIDGANTPETDFPIQNLPYGVISSTDRGPRCAVAIGDQVLDLAVLEEAGLIDAGRPVFDQPSLNAFMGLGKATWSAMRVRLTDLLTDGGDPALKDNAGLRKATLLPLAGVRPDLPVRIGDYTDLPARLQCRHHVSRPGKRIAAKLAAHPHRL